MKLLKISYLSMKISPWEAQLLGSKGEIVAHGRPSGPQSEALRAIFSRHDRSQHSERRAMLKVVERLGEGHASLNATGSVRLFSCHTPCMSCLFVFAQFRAMYPKVRLTVAFMSWTETYAALQEAKRDGQHRQNGMVCGFYQGKDSMRGRVLRLWEDSEIFSPASCLLQAVWEVPLEPGASPSKARVSPVMIFHVQQKHWSRWRTYPKRHPDDQNAFWRPRLELASAGRNAGLIGSGCWRRISVIICWWVWYRTVILTKAYNVCHAWVQKSINERSSRLLRQRLQHNLKMPKDDWSLHMLSRGRNTSRLTPTTISKKAASFIGCRSSTFWFYMNILN